MLKRDKNQKGFAAFYLTVLILAVVFTIGTSISILIYGQEKISRNIVRSSQAYYTAEAGIEDALLRLEKKLNWSSPYLFNIGNNISNIEISDIIGGSRVVIAEGSAGNQVRKIEVSYGIKTCDVAFRYGVQIDEGGIVMHNNSEIKGNIFSNGSIVGAGVITGDVVVASASIVYGNNEINGLEIGEESGADAYAYSCQDCEIWGKLYLSGGSAVNCTADEIITETETITKKELPITQEQIDGWETEASSSEIHIGDYVISGGDTESFGPRKIEGSLTIKNNAVLIMEGTIWVTGLMIIENNAVIRLDQAAYGSKSGVLIVDDGKIIVENGAELFGSGEESSYLMLLSTNTSQIEESPAIDIGNNSIGAIFYTNKGLIVLNNNMEAREVTGYKILLKPNTVIEYETGLMHVFFTSGPGGSWEVSSWKEIE